MSKIVLITGSNTGIGLEVVKALVGASKPYTILMAGRTPQKVHDAISTTQKTFPSTPSTFVPLQVDLESDNSIEQAFTEVNSKFGKLDVLINNGGATFDHEVLSGKLSARDMWNKTWNVNTAGTHILTSTFAPLLLRSSDPRLLFLTSGTSTLAGTDNLATPVNQVPPKGWPKTGFNVPAYRSSKTGLNMLMREWHRWLKEDGAKVFAISPGYLATGLGGDPEASKKHGAQDLVTSGVGAFIRGVIEGERDADAGKVINKNGVQAW
ncbi:NAD(P)-binding protein [Aspergillus sclerotioniger CBS 115572]|uniref:NAD(P)-binding protein n=1 Tax=Aspergillus sclerotioniger CBS 115572 TaxID=1450535 RepID=A0A317XGH2_9EURO|nr:NAD(P)-binding protein [Aspergillus sclerotioniger CBS 115572]PWY96000.1 NAD(P)-binding protein [Aspergillus sclerotioniger CBS 115572]